MFLVETKNIEKQCTKPSGKENEAIKALYRFLVGLCFVVLVLFCVSDTGETEFQKRLIVFERLSAQWEFQFRISNKKKNR